MRFRRIVPLAAATALTGTAVAVAVGTDSGRQAARVQPGPLFAAASGKNEIAVDGSRKAGDRDGRGSFSAVIDENEVCFGLVVKNIAKPLAAHVHKGPAGKNGDVVVTLEAPESGDPGAASGCTDISGTLARRLLRNPARYYVNVHNADFPGGAVRGQLFARSP